MRANMPFGEIASKGEFGTYFIGYARSPRRTEQMLEKHVRRPAARQLLRPDFDFSRAVTGTLFFVPTATFLDRVAAGRPAEPATAGLSPAVAAEPHPDRRAGAARTRSNVGSLKGEAPAS